MSQAESIAGPPGVVRVLVSKSRGRGGRYNAHNQPYHTDPNCTHVKRSGSMRVVDLSKLFPGRPECKWCAGEIDHAEIARQRTNPDDWPLCQSCGGDKLAGSGCEWCQHYEDVMGVFA